MIDWSRATPLVLEVRAALRELDQKVYLVGGPVRDLHLGLPFTDIDLLVRNGGEAVARHLAAVLGGRVHAFPEFLTFKVMLPGQQAIDIATSRQESYAAPGALPLVSPATIEKDLYRRDFSVNSIALEIHNDSIVDSCGGLADLEARILRALHDRSFIDDATRILRGLRLAVRLGFSFDDNTASLLTGALRDGAMESVSRERMWREIFLAMAENDPAATLLAMLDSGALQRATGHRTSTHWQRAVLPLLAEILRRRTDLDSAVVFTGALLRGQPKADELLSGSGLKETRRRIVLRISGGPLETLAAATRPELFAGFRSHPPEELVVLAAEDPGLMRAVEDFLTLPTIDLPFGGDALGAPPGPHIALALQRTREALMEGTISRGEALSFARDAALQYLRSERSS